MNTNKTSRSDQLLLSLYGPPLLKPTGIVGWNEVGLLLYLQLGLHPVYITLLHPLATVVPG